MGGWPAVRAWVGTSRAGALVDDARISVMDHGFTVADGVFETLKLTEAGPFAVTRHLRRLKASAAMLGIAPPPDPVIREAIAEVSVDWRRLGGRHGRLRVTCTSGHGPLGSDRGEQEPTLVVTASDTSPWEPATTAARVPWPRNERSPLAGAKTTSYAENVVALRAARDAGSSEALMANTRGDLCEGTSTNVFVVVDGVVLTPSLASGCLPGITRELVIEWFDAVEQDLPFAILDTADEVFLTSSTRDVHPVVRLDERRWSKVGLVSQGLQEAFRARAAESIDP